MLYIQDKEIKLKLGSHPNKLMLSMDSEKISQVFRNLITNSIKFMSEGEILISVLKNKDDDSYNIVIKDEGTGIPKDELEQIFSPFVQSSLTKGKASGAGLGLSICRKIITGHNGKIWAVNNENKGASIIFTLPIVKKVIEISDDFVEVKKQIKDKKITILMVDDEAACQMSMDLLLSGTGYVLISKYGGVSALKYLNENPKSVDLIFLDLMMPDMYGLNVLEAIKAMPALRDIPVIIQSGTNDTREIEKTISYGAKAYIKKPYQRQQILDIISDVFKNTKIE